MAVSHGHNFNLMTRQATPDDNKIFQVFLALIYQTDVFAVTDLHPVGWAFWNMLGLLVENKISFSSILQCPWFFTVLHTQDHRLLTPSSFPIFHFPSSFPISQSFRMFVICEAYFDSMLVNLFDSDLIPGVEFPLPDFYRQPPTPSLSPTLVEGYLNNWPKNTAASQHCRESPTDSRPRSR